MGLSSFWSQITGPRVKEITPNNRFSWEDEVVPSMIPAAQGRRPSLPSQAHVLAQQEPVSSFDDMKTKRRSRTGTGFSVKKQISEADLKPRNRKSWFGGKAEVQHDIPSVPALPSFQALMSERPSSAPFDEHFRPGTAVTTDEPVAWGRPPSPKIEAKKERRKSLFGRKRRSQSAASHMQPLTDESAPPLPPVSSASRAPMLAPITPTTLPAMPTSPFWASFSRPWSPGPSTPPTSGFVPASPKVLDHAITHVVQPSTDLTNANRNDPKEMIQKNRKSLSGRRSDSKKVAPNRRKSLSNMFARSRSKSTVSVVSNKSKRRSWFDSSNPDDGDEYSGASTPIPQVPPLVYGNGSVTPDSSVGTARSPDPFKIAGWPENTSGPARRETSIHTPRAVSGLTLTSKRKSYQPKNAAGSFLDSTTSKPRSSDRRSSYRHSLLDDGDGGMICFSAEQQREWDKLKHLMQVMDDRQDEGVVAMLRDLEDDEERDQRTRFSNAQALAALEFGEATSSGRYYD